MPNDSSAPSRKRGPATARLLVVELWGVGDVALAVPFLRAAAQHVRVSLLAKPHAASLVRRFCHDVEHIPLTAPWTAFHGKYRLHAWPWRGLAATVRVLRDHRFDAAVSARSDPRDHALLALSGANLRAGFPRAGSAPLLTDRLAVPARPHRAAHWDELARLFGWSISPPAAPVRTGRHLIIHQGAGHAVRRWPADRFAKVATRLRRAGWMVTLVDDTEHDLDRLLDLLGTADRFIGNDSGPGHLAALLGVPTFTIFSAQLPERFAPVHPEAAWIEGAACVHRPCHDHCHYSSPHCLLELDVETVWDRVTAWLAPR